jgi:hypothetical protein
LQVRFIVPPTVATEHAPSQVMLQVPEVQVTFEPAPAVCVHDFPAQLTLQPLPQVPVQVAPDAQAKLQPLVDEEHVSKPHDWSAAQLQFVPEHTVPQPDIARPSIDIANTTNARSFMSDSSGRDEWLRSRRSHRFERCPTPDDSALR